MGLFKKRTTDPAEIERLKDEIASMSARLQASESAKDELGSRVDGIVHRLDRPTPPPPEPPPPTPTVDPAEIDMINARISRLTDRIDEADAAPADEQPAIDPLAVDALGEQMQRIADRIDELDQRITSISTELANQITELSGELDGAAAASPPGDELVSELRTAQERLANEQARYQIAFRHDLAELADRLKRA